MKLKLTTLLLTLATPAFAAVVTDWQSLTPTTATGILDGVTVTSTLVNAGTGPAVHNAIENDLFNGPYWDAPFSLAAGTESINLLELRAGTEHTFTFSSPVSGLRFYIENFDLNSAATITVTGATGITLLGASSSFLFNPTSANTAQLTTTNATANGESDGLLEFTGAVSAVSMSWTAGAAGNAMNYTFAVPEPTSAAMLVCGAALVLRRRTNRTTERGA